MLPLHDGHIRLILLSHLVARLEHAGKVECRGAGIEPEQLDCLRSLSMADIKRLASLRHPLVGIVVDGSTFDTGIRNLGVVRETQSLEWYFIRHGASTRMMTALFKLDKPTAIVRLRAQGHHIDRGRPRLPPMAIRDRMHRFWAKYAALDLKNRYYKLHQAFSSYTLHTLSAVINEFEHPK